MLIEVYDLADNLIGHVDGEFFRENIIQLVGTTRTFSLTFSDGDRTSLVFREDAPPEPLPQYKLLP